MNSNDSYIVNPVTGEVIDNTPYKRIRARGGREVYMSEGSVYETFMTSLSSSLEIKIGISIIRDVDKNGILRYPVSHYEKKFNTSRNTVSKVFSKAKAAELVLNAGRRLYINPYAVLPYNIKDLVAGKLQQQWDQLVKIQRDNGKVTRVQALEVHERVFGNEECGSL